MYFYGKSPGLVMLECEGCGKVYQVEDRFFSAISSDYCVIKADFDCTNCGVKVPAGTTIYQKNYNPAASSAASASSAGYSGGVRCPHCGGYDCSPVTETQTFTKGYGVGKGCCGYILLGPLGLLCGACGNGTRSSSRLYWVCRQCGRKFTR